MGSSWKSLDEVTEDAATGPIKTAFQRIRTGLGVSYVPTLYQRLAVYEQYFVSCVDNAIDLISGPQAENFATAARSCAAWHVADFPDWTLTVGRDRQKLMELSRDYQTSNPRNLLFALAINSSRVASRSVMAEPCSTQEAAGDPQYEIASCHGDFVVPGFWRGCVRTLAPETLASTWAAVRPLSGSVGFARAQEALEQLARDVVPSEVAPTPDKWGYSQLECANIDEMLDWFKQALTAMIIEVAYVERLRAAAA